MAGAITTPLLIRDCSLCSFFISLGLPLRFRDCIRQVRRLIQDRHERERTGLFAMEGVRPIVQAFEHDWEIETLIAVPELLESPLGRSLVRQGRRAGPRSWS